MAKSLTMLNTIRGSLIENFYPKGWDLRRIDRCCDMGLKKVTTPARHWNGDFRPVAVKSVAGMDRRMGGACHIVFGEPQLSAEYPLDEWKKQTHRLGVALHPLTIEQNALHSFNSRFTLIPCVANSIGPGLFLASDRCIGGADGAYPDRGAMWQGMSLCVTLQYGPSEWITSSWMPTMPGRLFFLRQLGGPLEPDAH